MQGTGRGRGSYLGLLLESNIGKSMLASTVNGENLQVDIKGGPFSSTDKEVASISQQQPAKEEAKSGRISKLTINRSRKAFNSCIKAVLFSEHVLFNINRCVQAWLISC